MICIFGNSHIEIYWEVDGENGSEELERFAVVMDGFITAVSVVKQHPISELESSFEFRNIGSYVDVLRINLS